MTGLKKLYLSDAVRGNSAFCRSVFGDSMILAVCVGCRSLDTVWLCLSLITDKTLEALGELSSLRTLALVFNSKVTDRGIASICSKKGDY